MGNFADCEKPSFCFKMAATVGTRHKSYNISNLPNLIVSDVALFIHIIRELYSAHEECDV